MAEWGLWASGSAADAAGCDGGVATPVEEGAVVLVGLDPLFEGKGGREARVGVTEIELFVEQHENIILLHERVHLDDKSVADQLHGVKP